MIKTYWEIAKYNPPPPNHPTGLDVYQISESDFIARFGTKIINLNPPKPKDATSFYLFIPTQENKSNQIIIFFFKNTTKEKNINFQELQSLLNIAKDRLGILCYKYEIKFGWI